MNERQTPGIWWLGLYLVGFWCAVSSHARAQSPPNPDFTREPLFESYTAFTDELAAISGTADQAERTARLDTLWTSLRGAGQVPFAVGDRYAMLYRGSAPSVSVAGDFSSWRPQAARQVAGTDLWIYEGQLPDDARVDYKLILGSSWVLDPVNRLQAWSGFGPNSELRMPEYVYPTETIRRPGVARGTITPIAYRDSTALGYRTQHRLYLPPGYSNDPEAPYPVIYVTDGHEYGADYLGSLSAVLDNLIDDGSIRPTIAVYLDPRDPNTGQNRRSSEYINNPDFVRYVADEIVPAIDAAHPTSSAAADRMILGTSLGGLASAYFGAQRPEVFGKLGIQSPAFWAGSSIYGAYDQPATGDLEIFMTAGTVNDGVGGPTMEAILRRNGYDFTCVETNEGHSWANWRATLPAMLRELIGPAETLVGDFNQDGRVDAADYTVWRDGLGETFTEADYEVWRNAYGSERNEQSSQTVPEPSGVMLLALPATAFSLGCIARRCSVDPAVSH